MSAKIDRGRLQHSIIPGLVPGTNRGTVRLSVPGTSPGMTRDSWPYRVTLASLGAIDPPATERPPS